MEVISLLYQQVTGSVKNVIGIVNVVLVQQKAHFLIFNYKGKVLSHIICHGGLNSTGMYLRVVSKTLDCRC